MTSGVYFSIISKGIKHCLMSDSLVASAKIRSLPRTNGGNEHVINDFINWNTETRECQIGSLIIFNYILLFSEFQALNKLSLSLK